MKICLINPPLVSLKKDVLGSGIPYIPISLVYLATFLKSKGHSIKVIDGFGESPLKKTNSGKYVIQGLSIKEICSEIPKNQDVIFLYAGNVANHNQLIGLLKYVKKNQIAP